MFMEIHDFHDSKYEHEQKNIAFSKFGNDMYTTTYSSS